MSHPTWYSASFLTYLKSFGLSFAEGGQGKDGVLEVILMVGLLKLGDLD